ncbi:hypothetical protein ACS0TY_033788 [Phlomoides rotata]
MMLRIKRVPTVLSNYQKEESEDSARPTTGCGRNCLRSCCLPGAKLPLYAFFQKGSDGVCEIAYGKKEQQVDFLDSLLLGEVISGKYGFIAQLNEGRHLKKRPTEFRVDKVLQPFDESKFNFTKVGQEEVLFQFEASEDDEVHFYPSTLIILQALLPSTVVLSSMGMFCSSLGFLNACLRIDSESFLLALHMAV